MPEKHAGPPHDPFVPIEIAIVFIAIILIVALTLAGTADFSRLF